MFLVGCSASGMRVDGAYAVSETRARFWKSPEKEEKRKELEPLLDIVLPEREKVLSSSEIVNIALSNNPDTARMWERAKEAAFMYQRSLAPYYPSINFEMDYHKQYQSLGTTHGLNVVNEGAILRDHASSSWGPSLALKYTLWDFGKRSANAELYKQALFSANWHHNSSIQQVIRSALASYYGFLFEKEKLESLQIDLQDYWTSYLAAKEKLDNGVQDITDMLQAKTAYLQKKLEYESQVIKKENAYLKVLTAMGIPGNTELLTASYPSEEALLSLEVDAKNMIDVALTHRPDISASYATLLECEAALKKVEADLYPNITTDISGGRRWFKQESGHENNYSIQFSLNYPLFLGFSRINKVKQAKARVVYQSETLRQKELEVTSEVMEYYTSFKTAKNVSLTAKDFLLSAQEEFKAVSALYERGTKTILDVLSSLSNLADARAEYVQSKNLLFTSIANLSFATGILYTDSPEQSMQQTRREHP